MYSLCTMDCEELGAHVGEWRPCDRCGAPTHVRFYEVWHPSLGELHVGHECFKDLLGYSFTTWHEKALAMHAWLAANLATWNAGQAAESARRGVELTTADGWAIHENAAGKGERLIDVRLRSDGTFVLAYNPWAPRLETGFPRSLARAGEDLGLWRRHEQGRWRGWVVPLWGIVDVSAGDDIENPATLSLRGPIYHGTPSLARARHILQHGIQPDQSRSRKSDPSRALPGLVYVTQDLEYALTYALGANCAGYVCPPSVRRAHGRYGYLFVIPGETVVSAQPDEDSIGQMICDRQPKWLWRLARDVLGDLPTQHYDLHMDRADEPLLWLVDDGDYAAQTEAGKAILPYLSDRQMGQLIAAGAHIAHLGPLFPTECWRIDRQRSIELDHDGDNFFEVAERCQ